MFGFMRGVRGRAVAVVLVVAGLLGGVTASSVAAATSTTVTWKVSSLTAGQVKSLAAIASSNSNGVKTWSKTGSCVLSPKSQPTTLTMGSTGSCTLKLKIAKSGNYPAKTSTTTIILALYGVGDTGPGDGKIFYVDMTRAVGSQYFEAACAGWLNNCDGTTADPTAVWGCFGTLIAGAVGTAIGTGEQNTTDIVARCTTVGIAARRANDLVLGGKSDWFLPSKNQLNQMYLRRTAIGGFSPDYYWSSSESGYSEVVGYHAWVQDLNFGFQGRGSKIDTNYVRPVRAF